jgi:hypothetical protein
LLLPSVVMMATGGIETREVYFQMPGIQRMVFRLKEIVQRIDRPLHAHLASQGIQFIQFAFRWMNCLLMRELALPMITRMWDTSLAESAADIDSLLKTADEGAAPRAKQRCLHPRRPFDKKCVDCPDKRAGR